MGVAVLLLHTDDVGRVVRLGLLRLVLVEGEEAELEEVLDANCDLHIGGEENKSAEKSDPVSEPIRNQHCSAEITFPDAFYISVLLFCNNTSIDISNQY